MGLTDGSFRGAGLPSDYGDWKNTHRRFPRWRDKGVWEKLLQILMKDPDYEWLIIDATYCKAHGHAAGARGGNQDLDRTKGGITTKVHLAVDAHGMPVRVIITPGTTADCTQASALIRGINAEHLLADKAYDSDAIVTEAQDRGIQVVIPSSKTSKNEKILRRLPIQSKTRSRKCLPVFEEMAGDCNAVREAGSFLFSCGTDRMYHDVGSRFITTLSRALR